MTIIDIRPEDTGSHRRPIGEATQPIQLYTPDSAPTPRRPVVTGEFTIVVPTTIGIVDQVASVEMPATYAPPAPAAPGYWFRLTYTGGHRARGRIARFLGGVR